jgi:hypothetical protein
MSRTMTARSGRAAAREGGATRSTGNAPAIHRVFDCAWGLFLDCAGAEDGEGGVVTEPRGASTQRRMAVKGFASLVGIVLRTLTAVCELGSRTMFACELGQAHISSSTGQAHLTQLPKPLAHPVQTYIQGLR